MRRNSNVGDPMLVKLPVDGYEDTGEGGLAFFLIVRCKPDFSKQRQVCIAGDIEWSQPDCLLNHQAVLSNFQAIDAGLLIGSTGLSLWSDKKESYYIPTLKDLTPEGVGLYRLLEHLYGEVMIVTLLDT